MLINILFLCLGVVVTIFWLKLVKPKVPLNYLASAKDKSWLIVTGLIIVGVSYLYFYLPQVFRWIAVDVWGIPTSTVGEDGKIKLLELTDLGSLGDIYGSLNTLFTSATLAFVVYATLLQREANKDARDAMAGQLQQARDATAKQLRQARQALKQQLDQAREATDQQIRNAKELAHIQLEQANESTKQQLLLAQASHDAQIKESQHAIFVNTLNSLLLLKDNSKKNLIVINNEREWNHEEIFLFIDEEFHKKSQELSSKLHGNDRFHILEEFIEVAETMDDNNLIAGTLISYFLAYTSLISLIKKMSSTEDEKTFYCSLVANTMSLREQACLLWFSMGAPELAETLIDTHLFWINYDDKMKILIKFHEKSCFRNEYFLDAWDKYMEKEAKEENPA